MTDRKVKCALTNEGLRGKPSSELVKASDEANNGVVQAYRDNREEWQFCPNGQQELKKDAWLPCAARLD